MKESVSGCSQRITEAEAPVFSGLSPAQEQGKCVLLSLVVKEDLDTAHSVWGRGNG